MKTVNEYIVPIVESVRSININLSKVYPFATDRNLILTLEEQTKIQNKNIKETGDNSLDQQNPSSVRHAVIIFTVVLIILMIAVLPLTLYIKY